MDIQNLQQTTLQNIANANSLDSLNEIRVSVLGKNGKLTEELKNLRNLSAEEKPIAGQKINLARTAIESAIAEKQNALESAILAAQLTTEKIDITIDKKDRGLGSLHPLNQTKKRVSDFFISLGFSIIDSPEIDTDYYNFEALNIPADHPARDVQDTFFLSKNIVLRSHTSTGQIRAMEKSKPPLKIISIGKVYRSDDVDATHSPMFHQIEGLVVDKNITLCDLKGTLDLFAKHFFGENTKTRFRPSYFPFTEPSVEVDASCYYCGGIGEKDGKNCSICKGTGWIEILGAGIVNRRVLKNCSIDPSVYSGFAFGMGLDRITNILHSITDLRVVFENDVRFLRQFR